jgi:uncharacterized membrane protein
MTGAELYVDGGYLALRSFPKATRRRRRDTMAHRHDDFVEVSMSDLIVVAFDHFDDARSALGSLRELERDGRISFEDTALVERDPDGTTHVRNEVSATTEAATVVGAVIGGIIGFMFPLAGIALGAAAGAAVGVALDRGVSGSFVDDVKETLRPGRSALFLVVKAQDPDAVMPALRQFRGDVIQSTLSTEAEEALQDALKRQ